MALKTLFFEGAGKDTTRGISTFDNNGVIASSYSRWQVVEIVDCAGDLSIYCCGSGSKIEINSLKCNNLTLYAGHSGNITIWDMNVTGTVSIDIHISSEMWLFKGTINRIDGKITQTSFGKRAASAVSDTVQVDSSSRYEKG